MHYLRSTDVYLSEYGRGIPRLERRKDGANEMAEKLNLNELAMMQRSYAKTHYSHVGLLGINERGVHLTEDAMYRNFPTDQIERDPTGEYIFAYRQGVRFYALVD